MEAGEVKKYVMCTWKERIGGGFEEFEAKSFRILAMTSGLR